MRYAIVGAGAIGTAVAAQFGRAGTPVRVANSGSSSSLAALVREAGPSVRASTVEEALEADLIVLAVPYDAVFEVARRGRSWKGKIVVDATNAIDFPDFKPRDLGGRPSSRVVAESFPGAHIVKAFNTMWARVLKRNAAEQTGNRVLFLAGDNRGVNKVVADLVASWGFAPIDLGALDAGGLLIQFGGPLTAHSLISQPQGGPSLPEMDLLRP